MNKPLRVLILCTGNSARSQMAEGLLRQLGGVQFEVSSAGVNPTAVRLEAVAVMSEVGIDISKQYSKSVTEFIGQEFDFVITVCDNANEQCPIFPGNTQRLHWSFADPAAITGEEEVRLNAFRRIRDEIQDKLQVFRVQASACEASKPQPEG
jgi:arsenate reductase